MSIKEFKFIFGLILFLVIVLGVIGNVVSFIIWTKGKRCRKFAGSLYLTVLAVSDALVLCVYASYFAVDYVFGVSYLDINVFMCKLGRTAWHFTLLLSTWIVVCLTVERVLAVRWPLKSGRWMTRRNSRIIITVLIVLCFSPNIPWTFGTTILPVADRQQQSLDNFGQEMNGEIPLNTNENIIDEQLEQEVIRRLSCQEEPSSFIYNHETEWHKWFIDFFMLFSVPLGIITTSNIILLVSVCHQNSQMKTPDSRRSSGTRTSASGPMTARVVAIGLVHFLAVGPFSIAVLIPEFIQNIQKDGTIIRLDVVFTCFWFVNHGVNFVLYSLFGTAFRRDCYDFFCGRCSSRKRHGSSANIVSHGGSKDITGEEMTNISTIYDNTVVVEVNEISGGCIP